MNYVIILITNKMEEISFIDRMRKELYELNDRIDKLEDFLHSAKYSALEEEQKNLLDAQYSAMVAYLRILTIRLTKLS
jgi:hypothetical protein